MFLAVNTIAELLNITC